MKRTLIAWIVLFFTSVIVAHGEINIHYTVDLTRTDTDSFYVTLDVDGLKADSIIYQFAITTPGTYEVMNVGRFVGNFKALDISGHSLKTYRKNENQYIIYDAGLLKKIQYQVEDSYDTNIKEFPVLSCAGSNLENDNAIVNGQMIFGYFKEYQKNPISINFIYPSDWIIGTALPNRDEVFLAESYDHLVDSPILFGKLTKSTFSINNTNVDVFCYSQNKVINASIIADTLKYIVKAVAEFLGTLPVKHYTFLFHLRKEVEWMALEHNYSSFYAIPENNISKLIKSIISVASHEFCHVITPLNIHSDIIEYFDFEQPVASRHLWFYEGITNWMESAARLHSGLISESYFLDKIISGDLKSSAKYDSTVSLVESSLGCYDKYESEWYNAYTRGELVGVLLDLRILELSDYKFGLKDVIMKILNKYMTKSFPDEKFFDIIVENSYPEIREILERYVSGTESLPMKEYLSKIGYDFIPEVKTGRYEAYISKWSYGEKNNIVYIKNPDLSDTVMIKLGIKDGDVLKKLVYNGDEVGANEGRFYSIWDSVKAGDPFSLIVERDGKEITLTAHAGSREVIEKYKIIPMENPTEEQLRFRKIWITNHTHG